MTSSKIRVAYYVTGHGLGHATRVAEVCRNLLILGHSVTVCTAAPEWVFRLDAEEKHQEHLKFRKVMLDYGAKQADALSVDMVGSLEEYLRTSVEPRESLIEAERAWLTQEVIEVVVSDVVPLACAAAEAAGIPSTCVSNFSWDFVYAEYLTAVGPGESKLRSIAWQIAEDYSKAKILLRLPGYCPMPAFRDVMDTPLVVRKAKQTRMQVRAALGIPQDTPVVLYQFGGQEAAWKIDSSSLPEGWICLVASTKSSTDPLPPNFIRAPVDAYTPDLVAASNCVLGKIGYGTTSESLAHHVPLVYVRRNFFNEEPFLRKLLELHGCMVEMTRRDFFNGHWRPYLERALSLEPSFPLEQTDGGAMVARTIVQVAQGELHLRPQGQVRLRDAIVFGYEMARASSRGKLQWDALSDALDSERLRSDHVPTWYIEGGTPSSQPPTSPQLPSASPLQSAGYWQIARGSGLWCAQLPDTK
ncbi:hypothetical protein CYMTET_45520, partial [Cymbomonas tetramitiformis]